MIRRRVPHDHPDFRTGHAIDQLHRTCLHDSIFRIKPRNNDKVAIHQPGNAVDPQLIASRIAHDRRDLHTGRAVDQPHRARIADATFVIQQ